LAPDPAPVEEATVETAPTHPAQRLRSVVLVALFAALTAVGAFVRIPLPTGGPFTLQVPAVLLAGVLLGPARGAASQAAYLACGLLGLPVFASGGGPGYVLVPTFGFLVGFVPGALVAGAVAGDIRRSGSARVLAGMVLGIAAIYLVGVPWLGWNLEAVQGQRVPPELLRRMALVFLPLDVVKALLLLPLVRLVRARGGVLPR